MKKSKIIEMKSLNDGEYLTQFHIAEIYEVSEATVSRTIIR